MMPILLSIGPIQIYSFSVFLILAWFSFSFLFWHYLRSSGIEDDKIFDLTFYTSIVSLVTSRIVFTIFHWSIFSDSMLKVAALWVQPGLSLFGGLLGGILVMLLIGRRLKVRWAYLMDSLAMALPIPLIFGKIGSLLDGTEIGISSDVPWGISYIGHVGARHPVQVYEILVLVALIIFMQVVQRIATKRKWVYGLSSIIFFLVFSISMFFLEFLKEGGVYWFNVRVNQWVLLALFCETIGALYVKGGGKQKFQSVLQRRKTGFLKEAYAKIFRK